MSSTHFNYHDFHYLIEIAVNLNKWIESEKRLSTTTTRQNKTIWENKLKEWVKVNYEEDGIIQNLK